MMLTPQQRPALFNPSGGGVDTTPPEYTSSEVGNVDKVTVVGVLSESIVSATADYKTGWTIKYDAVSKVINTATRQANKRTIYFAMAEAAAQATVVTIEYLEAVGDITDTATNPLENIAAQTTTNNVLDPGGPLFDDALNSHWLVAV